MKPSNAKNPRSGRWSWRAARVACLGGTIGADTVWITAAAPVATPADSLGAGTEASLTQCASGS